MRCLECNVDLGEEYRRCQLCGAKADPVPPALEGLRTAEYPPVRYRPYRKPWTLIAALTLAGFFAVCAFFELGWTGSVRFSVVYALLLAVVWALFVRPLLVTGRRLGNYLVTGWFWVSLFSAAVSGDRYGSAAPAVRTVFPLLCALGCAGLIVHALLNKKARRGGVIYIFAFTVISLVLLACLAAAGESLFAAAACSAFCLVCLLSVRLLAGQDFADEFKARFHT